MTRLPSILLAPHHDNDDNGESAKNKECGNDDNGDKSQLLLLGKFEYGGGPIFKVVLEY